MPRKQRRKRDGTTPVEANNGPLRIGAIFALRRDALDRRTRAYRAFADLRDAIYADLGGRDCLSEVRRQLIDRFVNLCVWAETQDALAMSGEEIDADIYGRIAGHMKRLAESVGLERIPRDVTPKLSDYISAKPVSKQ